MAVKEMMNKTSAKLNVHNMCHQITCIIYRMAQMFDGENFDESKLHRQNFPYQYFTFQ